MFESRKIFKLKIGSPGKKFENPCTIIHRAPGPAKFAFSPQKREPWITEKQEKQDFPLKKRLDFKSEKVARKTRSHFLPGLNYTYRFKSRMNVLDVCRDETTQLEKLLL